MRRAYRTESFGIIYGPPHKKVHVLDRTSLPLLREASSSYDELITAYKLDTLRVNRDRFALNAPVIAFVELTRACNLGCLHCYNHSGVPQKDELTATEIMALLDELDRMGVFVVLFTGGEPLMRPECTDILAHAATLSFNIGMITNGMLLSEPVIDTLPRSLVTGISIDGTTHLGDIRPGAEYERLKAAFRYFVATRRSVSALITLTKPGLEDLDELLGWLLANRIPPYMYYLYPLGRAAGNPQLLPGDEDMYRAVQMGMQAEVGHSMILPYLSDIAATASSIDNYWDLVYRLEEGLRCCKGGRSITYITADGTVYPCSNCASQTMFAAGSIRAGGFERLWRESFAAIRSVTWDQFAGCADCQLSRFSAVCQYRCPPLAMALKSKPFACGAPDFVQKIMYYDRLIDAYCEEHHVSLQDLLREMLRNPERNAVRATLDRVHS